MKKVLVVENSPTIVSVADSLLRQRGYDVTCLSDGAKAMEFVSAEKPDLVLTAIGISGLDGLQLCKQISSDPLTGGIPVVLLISDKDDAYTDKIELSGARGIINKPFSPKELISIVDKYTGGIKQQAPSLVDQTSPDGPRLKPKVTPREIGTSTKNVLANKEGGKKHETVFNLEWKDLKDDPDFMPESKGELSTDDSGLILEEDQYGLTSLSNDVVPMAKGGEDEDYDWFIGEMKKEIEGTKEADQAKSTQEKPKQKPQVSYDDLESSKPASKDDAKYRQFLEQFKKDTSVMTKEKPPAIESTDINWLVDRVANKLAQKIVEKLDKDELKQIISSILSDIK